MTWPKLSIIIYSDANPEGCVRLLTSCEQLTRASLELEVILVLNGISQKVETVLREYAFSFDLKFVSTGGAVSRAVGRNQGVAIAKHEIILFLDGDLEVAPDLLYRHLELYKDEKTAAVMGEVFLPKFIKKNRWFRFLDGNYRSTRRWATKSETKKTPPLRYVNTANFSVRKSVYVACGGYSEVFNSNEAENIDLAFRIKQQNKGIIRYQAEALAFCLHPPLKERLRLKYLFGRDCIPKLLMTYPALYTLLPCRFVRMDGFKSETPVFRALMAALFTPPVYFVARGLRLLGPEFIAFRMMRYMLQYESIKGLKQSIRESRSA